MDIKANNNQQVLVDNSQHVAMTDKCGLARPKTFVLNLDNNKEEEKEKEDDGD